MLTVRRIRQLSNPSLEMNKPTPASQSRAEFSVLGCRALKQHFIRQILKAAAEWRNCLVTFPSHGAEFQALFRPVQVDQWMPEKETVLFGGGLRAEGATPSYSLRVVGFGCSPDTWQMHRNVCCRLSLGNASVKNQDSGSCLH